MNPLIDDVMDRSSGDLKIGVSEDALICINRNRALAGKGRIDRSKPLTEDDCKDIAQGVMEAVLSSYTARLAAGCRTV